MRRPYNVRWFAVGALPEQCAGEIITPLSSGGIRALNFMIPRARV